MTLFSLLTRNLMYFWRGNLAVLLGVLVGATVLTGALFVGDSLQGSLRAQTAKRLGNIDHAMVVPRFFRAKLADDVAIASGARIVGALMLQATSFTGEKENRRSIRGVTVLGVDAGFFATKPEQFGTQDHAWLNLTTAEMLGVTEGDKITLQLQKPEAVPREAGLGKKDIVTEEWEVTVAGVLGEDAGGAFNLRPELQAPRNVFVSLTDLQTRLKLPGKANALLASGDANKLSEALPKSLTLEDWGLTLWTPTSQALALVERYDTNRDGKLSYPEWLATRNMGKNLSRYAWVIEDHVQPAQPRVRTEDDLRQAILRMSPYLSLQSSQLLLTPSIEQAAMVAVKDTKLRASRSLVYLCRMDVNGHRTAGVVAATEPWQRPDDPAKPSESQGDKIVLLDNMGVSKKEPPYTAVTLRFKPPQSHGPTVDVVEKFTIAGYLRPQEMADPFLTPDFPGITDKDDTGAWDLPFDDADWKRNISREYGDAFWKEYRGTPKAYISLWRGKQLWGSTRFGELTSIRLALPEGEKPSAEQLETLAGEFRRTLLAKLQPKEAGFVFDDVKAGGMQASEGGTPFGVLFLCFSFFLILASLMLVGLLYRLNLDRRARQVGVWSAEGFSRSVVGRLLLGEGLILAFIGALLGVLTAMLYSRLLVDMLAWMWPGGTLRSLLRPHAGVSSMVYGVAGAVFAAAVTVWWVTRSLTKLPPRALLAGQTTQEGGAQRSWWLPSVTGLALLAGIALLVAGFFIQGQMEQAGTFFGSGMLLLISGIGGVRIWMRGDRSSMVEGHGTWSLARLGVRNAARHPARSLLAIGLLASAVFLIVAVESFRRTAKEGSSDPRSADGGFALLAETDLPVIRDPKTEVSAKLGTIPSADRKVLEATTIVALRARAGDDASCLNLYQPRNPRVLGVPMSMVHDEVRRFVFDSTLKPNTQELEHPWTILARQGDIAAFGESNTVTWMLKSGLGQSIAVKGEKSDASLRIAGLLHDSVFQSSLLISEENFLRLYPTHEGYNYFLIAPPRGEEAKVKKLLERALADRGTLVTFTKDRLAAYLAVENTYLSTFQALGGLGLLLGSLGLSVVLLRAVWERRAELALLRALGYTRSALGWLVLSENAFLLLTGLVVGATSALLSILPQLVRGTGSVPWANLAILFAGVLLVALTAASVATARALRVPIVPALRRE